MKQSLSVVPLVSVKVWCSIALLFIYNPLVSQNAIDSTLGVLKQAERNNTSERYNAKLINNVALKLIARSPDSAFNLASRALNLAIEQHDSTQIAVAHNIFGSIYLNKALYEKALEEHLIAMRIFEAKRDSQYCAKLYTNIGIIYGRQMQYEKALESYNRALHFHQAMGNKSEFIRANTNIGFTYWKQGNYDLALEYHNRSLSLANAIQNQHSIAIAHINLGATYIGKKIYDSAQTHLNQALTLSRAQTNNRMLCLTLHYLAELNFATKQFPQSIRLAQESLKLAQKLEAREEELKTLKLLANIHFATRDYKESALCQQQYTALKDSLFNLENTQAIAALQALYTTEKKDKEITLLKRDADIQSLQISRQTTLRNSLLVGLALLLVLAAILANRYRLKKMSEEQLRQKNMEILRQQSILEDQAAEIELSNTELHETNLKLVDANDELQNTYKEIMRQQKILEEQAGDIEETNTRLQETNIELERLNKEKNEFLGIVAHDLKNPLGSIIVSVNNLQRYQPTITIEQQHKLYERILEVTSRMRNIIDDILDVNAIESGVMNVRLEKVSVSHIATEIIEQYRTQAEKKLLTIQSLFGQDVTALADAQKTHEVLDNLVSNAVKYSPPGKNIYVKMETSYLPAGSDALPMTNGTLRVKVSDEGPGISKEDMKKLFGKFTRLSARPTGGEHSTGLGLSIVKKMVEAMQGRVWCESELGKGATFIVELPQA